MVDEIVVISQNAIGIRRFVSQMERWSQTVLGHFSPTLIAFAFAFLPGSFSPSLISLFVPIRYGFINPVYHVGITRGLRRQYVCPEHLQRRLEPTVIMFAFSLPMGISL